jgi:hypothetical protein
LHHVRLIPVIDFVGRLVEIEKNFDEVELEFVVIWLFIESEFENLVDERDQTLSFFAVLGQLFRGDCVFNFFDMGKFLLLSLL